jgi:hypothetical protein
MNEEECSYDSSVIDITTLVYTSSNQFTKIDRRTAIGLTDKEQNIQSVVINYNDFMFMKKIVDAQTLEKQKKMYEQYKKGNN